MIHKISSVRTYERYPETLNPMKSPIFLFLLLTVLPSTVAWSQDSRGDIPDDLLNDEHVLEEFGGNQFTTPSIRKIFEDLESSRAGWVDCRRVFDRSG